MGYSIMDILQSKMKSFFSGIWYTFKIKGAVDSKCNLLSLKKQISRENKWYSVEVELFAEDDLLCMGFLLKKKSSTKKRKREEIRTKHLFMKCILSIEDGILLTSRSLRNELKAFLYFCFKIESLELYDLMGYRPKELLKLYKQSQKMPEFLELQHSKFKNELEVDDQRLQVYKNLGKIDVPNINKLTSNIDNVPLDEHTKAFLKDKSFKFSTIHMTIQNDSILKFYNLLAENDFISEVPKWLATSRSSGKTHSHIRF